MIYVTGDTHGLNDFQKLEIFFNEHPAKKDDVLLILGDCAVLWNERDNYTEEYSSLGLTVLFIDGNHENFEMLNALSIVEIFGAKAHKVSPNVFHILRGEIMTIEGKTFLAMGGATSIDKYLRRNRISWWEEENITKEDLQNAYKNLERYNYEVDYVITHCAPTSTLTRMFPFEADDDTDKLDELKARTNFKKWYFGHYHEDKTHGDYRCFYYDIATLD